MTMTDVAFDLLVVEQLSEVVPCEGVEEGDCVLAAAWVYVHQCGESWLYCTPHRAMLDRWLKRIGAGVCENCDKPMPGPLPWSPL